MRGRAKTMKCRENEQGYTRKVGDPENGKVNTTLKN